MYIGGKRTIKPVIRYMVLIIFCLEDRSITDNLL